jgi:hypothetical protein
MSKLNSLRTSNFFVLFVSMAVLLVPMTLPMRNEARRLEKALLPQQRLHFQRSNK